MDYQQVIRHLRIKANDKAVSEHERTALLAKADELEKKYGKTGAFSFTILPPATYAKNPDWWAEFAAAATGAGYKTYDDIVEEGFRYDDEDAGYDDY